MAKPKKPAENHLVDGTKSKAKSPGILLPEKIRSRIPFAEWAKSPDEFSVEKFVSETSEYLFQVYGIGSSQDRHILMMLADQMQVYVNAIHERKKHPMIVKTNAGKTWAPNPYTSVANEAMKNIVKLMNELGLTPQSRLSADKVDGESPLGSFLKGWKNEKIVSEQ